MHGVPFYLNDILQIQELDTDVEIILPPPHQFQDSVSEETSTDGREDTPKFEISTQTSYGLVVTQILDMT